MGFPDEFVKHYGVDGDVNCVLLMADLILYGSFSNNTEFPTLLIKAMSFKIPIFAPNLEIITKYVSFCLYVYLYFCISKPMLLWLLLQVVDKVHELIFNLHDLSTLVKYFFLLIEDQNLSSLGYTIASSGKAILRNMLALDCISDYAKLLEKVLISHLMWFSLFLFLTLRRTPRLGNYLIMKINRQLCNMQSRGRT